jgi:hypothetical protein
MPSTSQTLVTNAVLASTLADRAKGYVDSISKQIPLFWWLKRAGRYKPAEGDRIEWAIEYALDDSEGSFHGYDTLPLIEQDNVTIGIANWKQYHKTIVISGLDRDVKNRGSAKVFDLLEQKEKNALNSLHTEMNSHFYLDGTGNSSKRVTGLGAIIAEAPTTGTLFGINRATAGNEYWRNQNIDTNSYAYASSGSVPTMLNDMERLWVLCGRLKGTGSKRYPDLILSTETYWRYYVQSLQKIGTRYVNVEASDAGFKNVTFNSATMIEDQDCPQDAGSAEKAFFINSDYMALRYGSLHNFKVTPFIEPADQNAFAAKILWAGELTSSLCAKHGIHQGITSAAFAG